MSSEPLNDAMVRALAVSLFKSWQNHEQALHKVAELGRSIIQNVGNPQTQISKADLIAYVKQMKQLNDEAHRQTRDITTLTINFVLEHMIPKNKCEQS